MSETGKHKNDPYGDIGTGRPDENKAPPAIPAATVILLRDNGAEDHNKLEVLMLRKTSKISFGGMWVFPGGKIDAADYPAGANPDAPTSEQTDAAARNAAARETAEEANLRLTADDFIDFAHWTPPPTTPKRFATWFFVAKGSHGETIEVDGGEIDDHKWISPAAALAQHAKGDIDLVPPTWVSLYQLTRFKTVAEALAAIAQQETRRYVTHLSKRSDGVRVAIWDGDDGYESWDADSVGETHRLTMAEGGFVFEHSAAAY